MKTFKAYKNEKTEQFKLFLEIILEDMDEIEIDYCGTVEVVINGNRTYTLTRETAGRDIIGNRLFDIAPKVDVRQVDGSIKRVVAKVYKY